MTDFSKALNLDYIASYQALDQALQKKNYQGGIAGYLAVMEALTWYEKRTLATFDAELSALRAARVLYNRLARTADLSSAIATEDDVDYLKDLAKRLEAGCDPLAALEKSRYAKKPNNPDAIKAEPIESTAVELHSRPTLFKEGAKKKALKAAALFALALTVVLKIRKGFIQ